MDKEALYWIFSTAPQALAALVGLLIAGIAFIYGKIDDLTKDPTMEEIGNTAKNRIHFSLKKVLGLTVSVIVIDLIYIFFLPTLSNWNSPYESGLLIVYIFILCIISIGNIFNIIYAIVFTYKIYKPTWIKEAIKQLSIQYSKGDVETAIYLNHFISFERIIRKIYDCIQDPNRNLQHYPQQGLTQILFFLANDRIVLNRDQLPMLREAVNIRNVIVHGGNIEKVSNTIDREIVTLTQQLEEWYKDHIGEESKLNKQ